MDVYRYTGIFHVATTPANLTIAEVHTGGWTENVWSFLTPAAFKLAWDNWFMRRACLLPKQASIIGYRSQKYTIQGNKLVPGGTTNGVCRWPGNAGFTTDLPQVALTIGLSSANARNTTDWKILCVPDDQMVGGEYAAVGAFPGLLTAYLAMFASGNFAIMGRELANPMIRVTSIAPHTIAGQTAITLNGVMGVGNGDFVRLLRVRTDEGETAEGVFYVVGNNGANIIYVTGYKYGVVTNPNGFARFDELGAWTANKAVFGRASIRKVGKPSAAYRGRGSKRRR